jgi:hypothetical protein
VRERPPDSCRRALLNKLGYSTNRGLELEPVRQTRSAISSVLKLLRLKASLTNAKKPSPSLLRRYDRSATQISRRLARTSSTNDSASALIVGWQLATHRRTHPQRFRPEAARR